MVYGFFRDFEYLYLTPVVTGGMIGILYKFYSKMNQNDWF